MAANTGLTVIDSDPVLDGIYFVRVRHVTFLCCFKFTSSNLDTMFTELQNIRAINLSIEDIILQSTCAILPNINDIKHFTDKYFCFLLILCDKAVIAVGSEFFGS